MVWFKRFFLFILVNCLVVATISVVLSVFNVQPYLTRQGLDLGSLMAFCLIWGMVGSGISLLLSRSMAKWLMGVRVVDPSSSESSEKDLVSMVHRLARKAGMSSMPEVGIYPSSEVNAFATGPCQSRSLVAVSRGLLNRMSGSQVEGVLAHEVSHIVNGDMVTMTLLQGIVNAFVMFLARVLSYMIVRGDRRDENSSSNWGYYSLLVFVFEMVFMVLGLILISAYSRFREYRADSGGARLVGKEKMVGALMALEQTLHIQDPRSDQSAFQAFKISGRRGWFQLFSSHPPLEERIQRLKESPFN